jgi:hypothetical protein
VVRRRQRPRRAERGPGFIRCYGLLWNVAEIDWTRSPGKRFRLLGRRGIHRGTLQVCDFRQQRGIYVLYKRNRPYYVGITTRAPIGDRLKTHLMDERKPGWNRFSWYGFRAVLDDMTLSDGTHELEELPEWFSIQSDATIEDLEALLIRCVGTQRPHGWNSHRERFSPGTEQWAQIMRRDVDKVLARLEPS